MEFRHRPLQYPGVCSLKEQVNDVEYELLKLGSRIRGLEDSLDNPDIEPTLREVIEEEVLTLKSEIAKHKGTIKTLHKDKSQHIAILTVIIFIILCLLTMFKIFYSWY